MPRVFTLDLLQAIVYHLEGLGHALVDRALKLLIDYLAHLLQPLIVVLLYGSKPLFHGTADILKLLLVFHRGGAEPLFYPRTHIRHHPPELRQALALGAVGRLLIFRYERAQVADVLMHGVRKLHAKLPLVVLQLLHQPVHYSFLGLALAYQHHCKHRHRGQHKRQQDIQQYFHQCSLPLFAYSIYALGYYGAEQRAGNGLHEVRGYGYHGCRCAVY